ncbi:MAG: DUF4469 domain-containing protein [Spirochaetaceae bacterium]|jgi:hypothetical protein|nr:DUF4469 domain-containing protein [Spirochaetaceae bacterium]
MGGVLGNEHGSVGKAKNKLFVRFRALCGLRKILGLIEVISEGMAETAGYIAEIEDAATGLVNDVLALGKMFTLWGGKIKIEGDPRKTGVFFCQPGSPAVAVKVSDNLAVNDPSKIVGIVPEPLPGDWYIEVRAYYSGSAGKPLKEMRTIRSKFTVRQA